MAREINIKKGLDIPLAGKAEGPASEISPSLVGICPEDFPGLTWKCDIKPGDHVKAGSPLFHAKEDDEIKLVSPVSGTVEEVRRGERRRILAATVKPDGKDECETFGGFTIDKLKHSGLWAMMRQRPYDVVPAPSAAPRDIFVTAFDSAPLAPSLIPPHLRHYLDAGLALLSTLTEGKVYLGVRADQGIQSKVAETLVMNGPHPAGNVGTQIAAVRPVNKGETVWTLGATTAARIGMLSVEGRMDYMAEIAVTGPVAEHPGIKKAPIGTSIQDILGTSDPGTHIRVISGNVLTGTKVSAADGFLRFPYRQVTLIPEGDDADEFMGWASLNPNKFSVKRTFPAFLTGLKRAFPFDARIKGGHRAMILSGELDKVFPFDIYPEYLIKAMAAGDFDRMEKLGIYEVAPEDFALPEFVDTSKQELQKLVRESLDSLRKDS